MTSTNSKVRLPKSNHVRKIISLLKNNEGLMAKVERALNVTKISTIKVSNLFDNQKLVDADLVEHITLTERRCVDMKLNKKDAFNNYYGEALDFPQSIINGLDQSVEGWNLQEFTEVTKRVLNFIQEGNVKFRDDIDPASLELDDIYIADYCFMVSKRFPLGESTRNSHIVSALKYLWNVRSEDKKRYKKYLELKAEFEPEASPMTQQEFANKHDCVP